MQYIYVCKEVLSTAKIQKLAKKGISSVEMQYGQTVREFGVGTNFFLENTFLKKFGKFCGPLVTPNIADSN
jgi:hypothetical protein